MPRRHSRHEDGAEAAEERDEQRQPQSQSTQVLIDPYTVLGLTRKADSDAIKKAYFAKVREFPPERDPEAFKKIRAAYDMLRTPEAKAATDLFLPHPPALQLSSKRPPTVVDLGFHTSDWAVLLEAFSDLGRADFRSDFRELEV